MKRPPKISNLIGIIKKCIDQGRYLDTRHATDRRSERKINRLEIRQVLKSGFHERRKDHFDETHRNWNYSMRGKTIDRRELRIIVSFDENKMLIITAIDLRGGG